MLYYFALNTRRQRYIDTIGTKRVRERDLNREQDIERQIEKQDRQTDNERERENTKGSERER